MEFSSIVKNMEFYRNICGKREIKREDVDFEEIAKNAYEGYKKVGCEFGVITSVSAALGIDIDFEKVMEIKKELPFKWGAVCGAVTGAFVLFSLLLEESDFEEAAKKIIKFHNETPLPHYGGNGTAVPKASADSILCRDSILNWTRKTGIPVRSPLRSERCGRVTADIAVETLNIIFEKLPVSISL
ncbi:C-GCAxxG-C-C family protein [Desulfurobacterium atlanticum]|uniref:Putative redox-active protein (C_GCAxxG_C_C) n=1 Tax=Desulfurobacterium atlanticum TaxID=240169 RepID=A0A238ZB41_9BACT|nr:C-GCAxxG-C-C family protein [Desulfurobacterium atlanticum]SNR80141.1 Putative redox-active protein (C_GCAxxG_C_C) [Desulfurobacterium atlanticum]